MRLIGVVVAILPVLLSPAWAGDRATWRDLPALTPKGHPRIMTLSDQTSTSRCIGKPVTPLCAVETKMACFLRLDTRLCDMVGYRLIHPDPDPPPWSIRYSVTRAMLIDDRHFPWPPSSDFGQPKGVPAVQVGDMRIEVRDRMCVGPQATLCALGYGAAEVYVVRKQSAVWRLMGWMPAYDLFPR